MKLCDRYCRGYTASEAPRVLYTICIGMAVFSLCGSSEGENQDAQEEKDQRTESAGEEDKKSAPINLSIYLWQDHGQDIRRSFPCSYIERTVLYSVLYLMALLVYIAYN
ncbi:hypothetical protein QAD02_016817 [Eretmocerus hayati]|uniref:Uncharacterized protein n=1 Tax=Eretmocerus hayati TaxID=131215 RepID=A0ACC2PGZ3_9HYME|nr:hypothetical protein QAD02_016817 [Eretmocerus hayati]